jgi:citrate synthase
MLMGSDTITVIDNSTGKRVDLPIIRGTDGPATVDIRDLSAKLGYFTYDPGFMSTASCRSQITYIDGNEGILRYRGYPIEQLAEKSTYLEVCYLLFYGELPTSEQLDKFSGRLQKRNLLQEQKRVFYNGFRRDAHPMAIMVGVVGALSAFYHETTNVLDPRKKRRCA